MLCRYLQLTNNIISSFGYSYSHQFIYCYIYSDTSLCFYERICFLSWNKTLYRWACFGKTSLQAVPGKSHCKHTCPWLEGFPAFLSKWSSQRPFQQDHVATTTEIMLCPWMFKRKKAMIIPGNTCSACHLLRNWQENARWLIGLILLLSSLNQRSRNKQKVWQCGEITPRIQITFQELDILEKSIRITALRKLNVRQIEVLSWSFVAICYQLSQPHYYSWLVGCWV